MKWDPFRFNTTPARLANMLASRLEPGSTAAWDPAVDIFENEHDIVIKAELPGMEAKDIEVRMEKNVLTIKGERRFEKEAKEENYHRIEREYGSFSRMFSLATAVDEDKIAAEYKDGVLKIVLPKREEAKPKPIKIAAA
jgi:HSP20 family protein